MTSSFTTHPTRSSARDSSARRGWVGPVVAALVFVALTAAAATIGGLANQTAVDTWYAGLERPWYAPPNAVFGPVWSVLYVTIAAAGWLIWDATGPRRRAGLALWGLQLALNLAWSVVFFGQQSIAGGMAVIVGLLATIVALMLLAGRLRPVVSWLLLPYAAWVSFATALNAGFLALN